MLEVLRVEVGLQMQFNLVRCGRGKSVLEKVQHLDLLLFVGDLRIVDEGQHHAPRTDALRASDHGVEVLFPMPALFGRAADQGMLHEPVTTQRGCADAVFGLERVELTQTGFCENGVGAGLGAALPAVEVVVDPLDVAEASGFGLSELVAPSRAREGLKTAILWRGEPALHDTVAVRHRVLYCSIVYWPEP